MESMEGEAHPRDRSGISALQEIEHFLNSDLLLNFAILQHLHHTSLCCAFATELTSVVCSF